VHIPQRYQPVFAAMGDVDRGGLAPKERRGVGIHVEVSRRENAPARLRPKGVRAIDPFDAEQFDSVR
jgi:hypothetical protein